MELEREGPCPKDYSKVDRVHQSCLDVDAATPAYFRLENPDTRWDDHPECYWIERVRYTLSQLTPFNLMALHRPYVFNRQKSRTEALKASLDMLHRQMVTFRGIKPNSWKK